MEEQYKAMRNAAIGAVLGLGTGANIEGLVNKLTTDTNFRTEAYWSIAGAIVGGALGNRIYKAKANEPKANEQRQTRPYV